jgi:hypothetical protein
MVLSILAEEFVVAVQVPSFNVESWLKSKVAFNALGSLTVMV